MLPSRLAKCCVALLLVAPGLTRAQQAACPSCAEGSALVKRFDLPEAATPVRDRPGWASPKKIVTTGGEAWGAALRAVAPGAEVVTVVDARATPEVLANADVYVGLCSPAVVSAGTSLKWIQLISAGADRCAEQPGVRQRGILLTNAQGVFGPQLGDHAMGLLLALTRRLHRYSAEQRNEKWTHPVADVATALDSAVVELDGKAMLVVGLGGVGTEIARRAHAFGMRVRGTRSRGREGPPFVEYVGLADEVGQLAAWADVVVNATPLTPQTRAMFNAAFFERMKPAAYFINISRGESVVTSDLVDALRNKRIAGAGLDVTDPEPLPAGHPLWSMPNVVITPHSGGASDQVKQRILTLAVENLRRYVAGEKMISVVDVQRGY